MTRSATSSTASVKASTATPTPVAARVRQLLQWERDLTGVYLSDHPMGAEAAKLASYVTHYSEDMNEECQAPRALVAGVITVIKKVTTKKKQEMAVVTLEDLHGTFTVVVFPQVWAATKGQWVVDELVVVIGDVSQKEDPKETSVLSDQMWRWDDVKRMTPTGFRNIATAPPKGRRGPPKVVTSPPLSERTTTFASFDWRVFCRSVHGTACASYDAHHMKMSDSVIERERVMGELPGLMKLAQDIKNGQAIGLEPLWPSA